MGRSSREDDEKKHRKRSSHDKKHKKSSRDKKERKKSSDDKSSRSKRRDKKEHSSSSRRDATTSDTHLTPLGDALGHAPSQPLNADRDYFAFHEHLFVYLYRQEGRAFNDLTSDETHQAFTRFVDEYNSGRLPATFYQETIPAAILEECKTTRHKWKFQISDAEDKNLRTMSNGIKSQTDHKESAAALMDHGQQQQQQQQQQQRSKIGAVTGPANKTDQETSYYGRSAEDRYQDRVTNQRLKCHVQTVHDELTGGKADYGRDRQLEKRREIGARTHAASRDREDACVELNDDAVFGSGDAANFQSALQREKQHAAKRQEKQKERAMELQRKEESKKEEMMKQLGLVPGRKITIAPRNDG
ncbi:hypothetical protein MPSEU_001080900 [Mayamaea pseudoterrestris]|nr:hypothetical protein MPSEU_001080900 [Mayamaea pseudoterrestris]